METVRDTASPETAVVIGAGPAGLTAAYELSKAGILTSVLESGSIPGGLARTEEYKGYRFDIGGHRFFTKVRLVENIWKELLGDDFLARPRLSRIYCNNRFFKYPLEPTDALTQLGLWESAACGFSFLYAKCFPMRPELTFDAWVSNRFGRRLFRTFFKSYTEKVWGIPCDQIDAQWAAQRIRGLDAISLVKNMILPKPKDKGKQVTTLIDSFHYPRLGPGMMWEECARRIQKLGGSVTYGATVDKIHWEPGRVVALSTASGHRYAASNFISTMPVREFVRALDPPAPPEILKAAEGFKYRDFITVALILKSPELFPDNWIYVHDPAVHVGRIQNFKNWSPEMVPEPDTTCLGLEYFCSEGDALWNMTDRQLVDLAVKELKHLGIASGAALLDGTAVRVLKAYPVYDGEYKRCLQVVRGFLSTLSNFQTVGRNGMHHYNNQDHSMLTGVLAARNILGGNYDVWQVNTDSEYHESGGILDDEEMTGLRASQPAVPKTVMPAI